MNTKPKLSKDSAYILEDNSDDEQILFDCMDIKTNCKNEKSKVNSNTPEAIPVSAGKRYKQPRMYLLKYKGPPQKDKVLLAVMDVNLNKLKEGEEVLPDLHKKWME
jgi:hypothetical protein